MFLRQLTYLVAIDRFRHFSRAAEHCGVSQPALSAAIRQLEHELGVTIVRRRQRVLGLTPEGERVLAWARQSLTALDGLRQEADFAHEVAGGSLAIGIMPPAQQLAPLLMESLRAAIPALHLDLTVAAHADILRGLAEQRFGLGIVYLDQLPVGGQFEVHELYAEQHVLVGGPGITLPGRTRCAWGDAAELPLCLLDRSMRSRQIIDRCFAEADRTPDVRFETNALALLHAELAAGRLASILPVAALPPRSCGMPLQVRRLEPSPTPAVGLVRVRQAMTSALMARCWHVASGLVLTDALKM
ncbi:LysR family transcriptional regulator [Acidomonas methanolica]|uniref:Transcriptional regulator LysR n=1 Tax=Acidomonas methanolica NBRC 104435 TaxID=1231351 RepID=A0A023D727_ACIMT|nr:LysR substrate-binding domain-containing protein [Acidomonas methanolica]MBU2654758.1 LysR family transcriptional regulator [Acidomonas methanolica]MCQ9156523.1 LysR family transcriptional regulator [Acidomonas methanolica]TCS26385.1 DNA-binding transcriptional LysR family regulator [Acidomonas methanolica]GAJ29972.1 transcriptional regulator LysR [Acidomonas methanolica NBRC 104435]GBQ47591.1 LysR family transcriptional regulator [Acidomonas methanolica]